MTEVLRYPGVYITEVATGQRPIEGVSTSIAGFIGPNVIGEFQRLVDQVPRDPKTGIALLEFIAWLADNLTRRVAEVPDEATARLATIALGLLKNRPQPPGSAIRSVRYLEGQLIEADDLVSEVGDKLKICVKKKNE